MAEYISRKEALIILSQNSYPVRYDTNSIERGMTLIGIEQAINELPTADVQPTERVIELEELLEECRRKFWNLLDLGMECTSEMQSIKKLHDKIQAKLKDGDTNDT